MAQILTRLKITWKAEEGPPEETSMTFNRIVITLCFILAFGVVPILNWVVLLFAIIFFIYVGYKLRRYMRQKYEIPPFLAIESLDDACCMIFCGCCSAIQMARHTHDDKEDPGACCTTNGLEYGAQEIV
jgi:hypothetical protein